jgi:cell division septal protein FtsQ
MKRRRGAQPRIQPRRPGRQARRRRPALRRRIARRLPRVGRILAGLLALACGAALVYLVVGPLFRVSAVEVAGARFVDAEAVASATARLPGAALLTVDGRALEARLERLPAVADAKVDVLVPDRVVVTLVEHEPAMVWQTPEGRLLATADGAIVASLPVDAALPEELATLPFVDDRRASRRLSLGDRLSAASLETVRRLSAIEPAALGSTAARLSVAIDAQLGYLLVSDAPAWQAAFGFYGLDEEMEPAELEERITEQVAAVRTLFATRGEAGVSWVDARNPTKIYFRAADG